MYDRVDNLDDPGKNTIQNNTFSLGKFLLKLKKPELKKLSAKKNRSVF